MIKGWRIKTMLIRERNVVFSVSAALWIPTLKNKLTTVVQRSLIMNQSNNWESLWEESLNAGKKNMSMAETQQHFYQGHMLISRRRAGHIIK